MICQESIEVFPFLLLVICVYMLYIVYNNIKWHKDDGNKNTYTRFAGRG